MPASGRQSACIRSECHSARVPPELCTSQGDAGDRARGARSTARERPGVHARDAAEALLARLRFAAVRGLCVDLDYVTAEGRRSLRRIEPHALRRTRDGHLVVYARRAGGRLHRAYRVERIRGARLTRQRFTPPAAPELGTWPDEG